MTQLLLYHNVCKCATRTQPPCEANCGCSKKTQGSSVLCNCYDETKKFFSCQRSRWNIPFFPLFLKSKSPLQKLSVQAKKGDDQRLDCRIIHNTTLLCIMVNLIERNRYNSMNTIKQFICTCTVCIKTIISIVGKIKLYFENWRKPYIFWLCLWNY